MPEKAECDFIHEGSAKKKSKGKKRIFIKFNKFLIIMLLASFILINHKLKIYELIEIYLQNRRIYNIYAQKANF